MNFLLKNQTFIEFRVKLKVPVNLVRSASSFLSLYIPWINFIASSFYVENFLRLLIECKKLELFRYRVNVFVLTH